MSKLNALKKPLLLICLALMLGCNNSDPPPNNTSEGTTALAIKKEILSAKQKEDLKFIENEISLALTDIQVNKKCPSIDLAEFKMILIKKLLRKNIIENSETIQPEIVRKIIQDIANTCGFIST